MTEKIITHPPRCKHCGILLSEKICPVCKPRKIIVKTNGVICPKCNHKFNLEINLRKKDGEKIENIIG